MESENVDQASVKRPLESYRFPRPVHATRFPSRRATRFIHARRPHPLLRPITPMRPLQLCSLLWLAAVAHALHFYLDTNERRCFIEELPTDTVVEGEWLFLSLIWRVLRNVLRTPTGHYKALEWSEKAQAYVENPELGILVEVDVRPFLSILIRATLTAPVLITGTRDEPQRRQDARTAGQPLHLHLARSGRPRDLPLRLVPPRWIMVREHTRPAVPRHRRRRDEGGRRARPVARLGALREAARSELEAGGHPPGTAVPARARGELPRPQRVDQLPRGVV